MEESLQLANRLTGMNVGDRVGSEHVERWIKILNDVYGAQVLSDRHGEDWLSMFPPDPINIHSSNIDEFDGIRIPAPRTKRINREYTFTRTRWRLERNKVVLTSSGEPDFITLKDLIIGAPNRPAYNPDVILSSLFFYNNEDHYNRYVEDQRRAQSTYWATDMSWDEYVRRREDRFIEIRDLVIAPGVTYAGEVAKILRHFVYLIEPDQRKIDEMRSFQRIMKRQITGRGKISKTGHVFDKNLSKLVKEIAKLTKDKREKAKLKTIINSISRQYKKLYNEKAAQDDEIAKLRAKNKFH